MREQITNVVVFGEKNLGKDSKICRDHFIFVIHFWVRHFLWRFRARVVMTFLFNIKTKRCVFWHYDDIFTIAIPSLRYDWLWRQTVNLFFLSHFFIGFASEQRHHIYFKLHLKNCMSYMSVQYILWTGYDCI